MRRIHSIDRLMECVIDGASFSIKIEELKFMEKDLNLPLSWDNESESTSEYSQTADLENFDLVMAVLDSISESDADGQSVAGSANEEPPDMRALMETQLLPSKVGTATDHNNEAHFSQNSGGLEEIGDGL